MGGPTARDRGFVPRLTPSRSAPIVVLSPHLDDAVLSCWSVVAGGDAVVVVNLFAGLPDTRTPAAWDAMCGATDAQEHVRQRRAEDADALSLAGRSPLDLPFVDAPYRQDTPPPSFAEIDAELTAAVPKASHVLAPAGVGRVHRLAPPHPDHLLAREFALALARTGMPVTLYADHPYCARRGWPTWITGGAGSRRVDAEWRRHLGAIEGLADVTVAEVRTLSPDEAALKLRALRRYASQFDAMLRAYPGTLDDPEIYGREVFWRPVAARAG
jgi:LmbE family N-acetylglucosaminyl deacetylase